MKTAKTVSTPRIFTTYDIGRMTGTDPTTVHKWIDKGLLRGYRTPGGHRRVRAEDLRSFLTAHRIPIPRELGGSGAVHVLAVDGNGRSLQALARLLKKLKPAWEVATAQSAVEALLMIPGNVPDVLVFEAPIPDAKTLAVCRHLKARAETASLKLIAVLARPDAELQRSLAAAGVETCLRRPIAGPELVQAIEIAVGIRPAA